MHGTGGEQLQDKTAQCACTVANDLPSYLAEHHCTAKTTMHSQSIAFNDQPSGRCFTRRMNVYLSMLYAAK